MPSKGKLKREIKHLDKAISFYIEKRNKSKQEIAYLHELLHKRHDCMLLYFYARKNYEKDIPHGYKVKDIVFDKPLMHNIHLQSLDDAAPDAFVLLEDGNGNQSALVHELKCGRSKRMVAKGIQQLDRYAREIAKTFDSVICLLTFGKRTKEVRLDVSQPFYNPDYFGSNGLGAPEI